jgi:hypothetical protein
MNRLRPTVAAFAFSLFSAQARAIELYASSPPNHVVITQPVLPPPRVVVVTPSAPTVIRTVPLAPVVTTTVVHAPAPEPVDVPSHPQPEERRDPRASVFVGAGYGGMTGFRSGAAGTWRLHLGLGLGATELGLRASIANRALDELSTVPGGAWVLSAEVAHRFLRGSTVRPVIGASFDRWQIDPDGRESVGAFGLGARGGLEVHYHLNPGAALVFGVDLAYHRILSRVDNAPMLSDVLTFGATADIRL